MEPEVMMLVALVGAVVVVLSWVWLGLSWDTPEDEGEEKT